MKRFLALFVVLIVMSGVAYASSAERKEEIAVDAYIYAYPMVLMELTRQIATNVPSPTGSLAPMNRFAHLKAFPDHTFKEVVRPNADTLYSILWFDVSKAPQVITVPDTKGRYYLLPMLDMWTDVFAVPGPRTSDTKVGNFAIVGPQNSSVTEVAMRWGFKHLSRFAECHKAMSGIYPKEALASKSS
jgi:hypothetical protein